MSSLKKIDEIIQKTKIAQKQFSQYSQNQIDYIFQSAAIESNHKSFSLAKEAVEETNMGIIEDKFMKNQFAGEYIYNKYKNEKTCDIIEHDEGDGYYKLLEPVGIIAGIIPTTNPTSTAIFKALIALKTRNAIIFSPHPRAKKCTINAARTILNAAIKAGAPENIIGWIEDPTIELTQYLMGHPDVNLILATGGPGLVKAAYSSGTPSIGVGSGNTPAVIDKTADINLAISSILLSKTFDNGLICASEQSIIVHKDIYEEVKKALIKRKCHFTNKEEFNKLRKTIEKNGKLNSDIVGQSAFQIGKIANIKVSENSPVIIAEVKEVGDKEPLSKEKLSPILAMYKANDFENSLEIASNLISYGGMGHTSVLYVNPENTDRIKQFGQKMLTGRVLINMPSSQGAIGDVYNFRIDPSLTLGCGSWGGNSIGENVSIKHLMNVKIIAERRENMLWLRIPEKIYFKYGCLAEACKDLNDYNKAFIVTDKSLNEMGFVKTLTKNLSKQNIEYKIFDGVRPDPDIADINVGIESLRNFQPDLIIALGGGSPMDASKIMWLLYEYPNINFEDMTLRFMDIRKRIWKFPKLGSKAKLIAIPTTSGTGSEVTPFAVISDSSKNIKYPIASYELTPDMAIIDPELVTTMPASLTAAAGIDAVVHSIEAIVAVTGTEFTNGLAFEALRLLFKYLPASYKDGSHNHKAKEKVHYAATIAGLAFANAFLGLCHAMAHKLGSQYQIPHGVANALLINHIIKYNSSDVPSKQTTFSQYTHPYAQERYVRIAEFLKLSGKTDKEKINSLIKAIEDLKKDLNLPSTITELGIDEKTFRNDVDYLSEQAFLDQCNLTNPRYALIKEIKELFLKLLKPKN